MLKRVIAVAVATIGLLAAPAAAEQYPPAPSGLAVSDTCPTPGQNVTISGGTFSPGATVTFTLGSTSLGTATADGAGNAALPVAIPAGTSPGNHTITAAGPAPDGQLSLSARVSVAADGCEGEGAAGAPAGENAGGGTLPRTGDDLAIPLMQIGLGLAAVGGVLLALSAKRRRRSSGTPA